MFTTVNKYNILFLDIETVSIKKEFTELSDAMQKLWALKHSQIYRNTEVEPIIGFKEKAAIYAEFGKIVCISCGILTKENNTDILRIKSFSGHDEATLLTEFASLLNKKYTDINNKSICGHNIKEFDIPYLCRRMLINNIDLPYILNIHGKKPWEINFIDTLQLWKFGDYKAYTSLNLLATVFDIPTPKDDIDGSMVSSVYWEEKNLERIKTYCQKDVITTVRLFQKFKNLTFVSDKDIQIVS